MPVNAMGGRSGNSAFHLSNSLPGTDGQIYTLIRTSAPADNDCEISKLSYICIFISYFGKIYCDFG